MQVDKQGEMEREPSSLAGAGHLSAERLAAFDHDPLSVEERAHVAVCAACRAEQEGYVALLALGAEAGRRELEADAPRLVTWDAIAEGLRQSERPPVPFARSMPPARWLARPARRRWAAAVVLLTGGALLGRLSGEVTAARTVSADVAMAGTVAAARPATRGDMVPTEGYATIEQATAVLERAQRDYERASLWLAANDTTAHDSDVYRARLAALDQMMAASRAALRDAPQDPVLNHYFLAAYTAREATLQQLGGTLRVDKTIERY
ncbi:MAG: hypothetical protein ACK5W7_20260 [Gemmatimonadaceae bacterium]